MLEELAMKKEEKQDLASKKQMSILKQDGCHQCFKERQNRTAILP